MTLLSRAGARKGAAKKKSATGPSVEVRALVLRRAGFCCEKCGRDISFGHPYSLQHRRSRGMGGSRRDDTNLPQNLIVLCGSATSPGDCHEEVERRRDWSRDHGWTLRQSDDPALSPVAVFGKGLTYLTVDGRYSATCPEGLESA